MTRSADTDQQPDHPSKQDAQAAAEQADQRAKEAAKSQGQAIRGTGKATDDRLPSP